MLLWFQNRKKVYLNENLWRREDFKKGEAIPFTGSHYPEKCDDVFGSIV